eukprot:296199-Chlamydomonas_euryale.AAC.1
MVSPMPRATTLPRHCCICQHCARHTTRNRRAAAHCTILPPVSYPEGAQERADCYLIHCFNRRFPQLCAQGIKYAASRESTKKHHQLQPHPVPPPPPSAPWSPPPVPVAPPPPQRGSDEQRAEQSQHSSFASMAPHYEDGLDYQHARAPTLLLGQDAQPHQRSANVPNPVTHAATDRLLIPDDMMLMFTNPEYRTQPKKWDAEDQRVVPNQAF